MSLPKTKKERIGRFVDTVPRKWSLSSHDGVAVDPATGKELTQAEEDQRLSDVADQLEEEHFGT